MRIHTRLAIRAPPWVSFSSSFVSGFDPHSNLIAEQSDKSYKLLDKSRNADAVDSAAGHLRTAEVLCPDNSCVLFMIQRLQAVAFVKTVKRAKSNENQMVEVHVWYCHCLRVCNHRYFL